MTDIAGLTVKFGGDISDLGSAVAKGITLFSDFADNGVSSMSAIAEGFSTASGSASSLVSALEETGTAAASAFAGINPSGVVTATDVARANLTLLESKVAEAREKLQTLQGAANAGESVTGIAEAEAQLILLMDKAQSAQEALTNLGNEALNVGEEVESGMSRAHNGISLFGDGLGGLINKAGMTVFNLQNMWQTGIQLASGLLGPAMSAETMQSAFTNLLGSTKSATSELQKLDTFAAHTPFATLDIDKAAASMVGFGFKSKDVIPDMTAIGDALSAVGRGTPAELGSVVDIFGKIRTQGKLTLADINQLGSHGINALQLIAQGAGLSTDAVKKMISNGTLPANQAIADLTKGIEKNPLYQGGMAKQSSTLTGIMSTLKSNFDQALASFANPILKALEPLFNNLATAMSSPAFKQFAATVGTTIVNGVTNLVKGFQNLVSFGSGVVSFFQNNQTAMDALLGVVAGLSAGVLAFAIASIPALVTGLITWAAAMLPVMIETLATAAPFILVGAIVAGVVFGIIEVIQHWGAISKWLQGAWDGITGFFSGLLNNIVGFFKTWGITILEFLLGPVGIIIHFWGPITTFFQGVWSGIVHIFSVVGKWFGDRFQEAWNAVTGIFSNIGQFLFKLWETQVRGWQIIGQWFHDRFTEAWNNITGVFSHIGQFLMGLWDREVRGWQTIGAWFHDRFTEAWNNITRIFGNVGNWFHDRFTDAVNRIGNALDGLKSIAQGVWNDMVGGLRNAVNSMIDQINNLIGGINNISGKIGIPAIPLIPHFEQGGFIMPGQVAMVGEKGPEIITGGSQGISVLGTRDTASLLSSGALLGSAPVVHVTVENHTHNYIDGQEMLGVLGPQMIRSVLAQGPVKSW